MDAMEGFFLNVNQLTSETFVKYGEKYKNDHKCKGFNVNIFSLIWKLPLKILYYINILKVWYCNSICDEIFFLTIIIIIIER